jgi:hypothetical protein
VAGKKGRKEIWRAPTSEAGSWLCVAREAASSWWATGGGKKDGVFLCLRTARRRVVVAVGHTREGRRRLEWEWEWEREG